MTVWGAVRGWYKSLPGIVLWPLGIAGAMWLFEPETRRTAIRLFRKSMEHEEVRRIVFDAIFGPEV
jgi:hypothetical protein